MAKLTMVEALNLALKQEMGKDNNIVLIGEDIGVDGGVFRVTDGLIDLYGAERVMDSPVAEAGIVGFSVGMAINGLKPVAEMQFSGFSYQAFHQIENHMSRYRWRTRGAKPIPMVLRMPYGAGIRALEHHSESREAYYAHTPGLKVVIPSSPRNARSLLVAAMRDPDPVIFCESEALYRAFREEVPEEEEVKEIGKAEVVREGKDLTLISFGAMMRPALAAAEELQTADGVQAEVIDLLTISPLDHETVTKSVSKTGRAVIIHEAPRSFGPAAEVLSRIVEKSFWHLQAPVQRVTGFDTIVPLFAYEKAYLPGVKRILTAARETLTS
jgi:pyruvate dehydrogenase E1 component beta subunit